MHIQCCTVGFGFCACHCQWQLATSQTTSSKVWFQELFWRAGCGRQLQSKAESSPGPVQANLSHGALCNPRAGTACQASVTHAMRRGDVRDATLTSDAMLHGVECRACGCHTPNGQLQCGVEGTQFWEAQPSGQLQQDEGGVPACSACCAPPASRSSRRGRRRTRAVPPRLPPRTRRRMSPPAPIAAGCVPLRPAPTPSPPPAPPPQRTAPATVVGRSIMTTASPHITNGLPYCVLVSHHTCRARGSCGATCLYRFVLQHVAHVRRGVQRCLAPAFTTHAAHGDAGQSPAHQQERRNCTVPAHDTME